MNETSETNEPTRYVPSAGALATVLNQAEYAARKQSGPCSGVDCAGCDSGRLVARARSELAALSAAVPVELARLLDAQVMSDVLDDHRPRPGEIDAGNTTCSCDGTEREGPDWLRHVARAQIAAIIQEGEANRAVLDTVGVPAQVERRVVTCISPDAYATAFNAGWDEAIQQATDELIDGEYCDPDDDADTAAILRDYGHHLREWAGKAETPAQVDERYLCESCGRHLPCRHCDDAQLDESATGGQSGRELVTLRAHVAVATAAHPGAICSCGQPLGDDADMAALTEAHLAHLSEELNR